MHFHDLVRKLDHSLFVIRILVLINQYIELRNRNALQIVGLWLWSTGGIYAAIFQECLVIGIIRMKVLPHSRIHFHGGRETHKEDFMLFFQRFAKPGCPIQNFYPVV